MAKSKKTNDVIQTEYEATLQKLSDMQNRDGKNPLTHETRCIMLNEIYDGTLVTLQRHLMMGVNKGTSAAITMLERSRLELIGLEETRTRLNAANGTENTGQHSMGFEYPAAGSDDTVEA